MYPIEIFLQSIAGRGSNEGRGTKLGTRGGKEEGRGDKETGRRGDTEKGRRGDGEKSSFET
ncbi:MAG: hypothetical protein CVT94_13115 [Bacteroidetes bacterium HGW-Bacteroidetes-11]|nr:MAG: hypothetical protein CVT94_13115 [Bacteroidetes bacterium HGW-Bacteroidetes-11]